MKNPFRSKILPFSFLSLYLKHFKFNRLRYPVTESWLYCAINDNLTNNSKKLKLFYPDGNHHVTEIQDVHKEIAKLGKKGWELITLQQITQPNARVYYFKKLA